MTILLGLLYVDSVVSMAENLCVVPVSGNELEETQRNEEVREKEELELDSGTFHWQTRCQWIHELSSRSEKTVPVLRSLYAAVPSRAPALASLGGRA